MNAAEILNPTPEDCDYEIAYVEKKIALCFSSMSRNRAEVATQRDRAMLAKLREVRDKAWPRPSRYDRPEPV